MTTGIYSHYKGNEYTVYGKVENISGDTFVLYRQNYGNPSLRRRKGSGYGHSMLFNALDF